MSFKFIPFSKPSFLSAHRKAVDRKLTTSELSASADWVGAGPANLHYGRLVKRIADEVSLSLNGANDQAWTEALAEYYEETQQWQMHEELALALDRLNMG